MHKQFIVGGVIGAGSVLVFAGLLVAAYHHESNETGACKAALLSSTSPSGHYRAEMKDQTCRWGLGLAANTISVKVEKLGQGGWFYTIPLEYDDLDIDQGTPSPTMEWSGPDSLSILVHTHHISGTLVRTDHELTVTRTYSSLPQP